MGMTKRDGEVLHYLCKPAPPGRAGQPTLAGIWVLRVVDSIYLPYLTYDYSGEYSILGSDTVSTVDLTLPEFNSEREKRERERETA